jgi:3-dehydroquinate synthase
MQGMVAAIYLSVTMMGLNREVLRQLSHVMVTHYGHASCACSDYDDLIDRMLQDKKNTCRDTISFTLLRDVGDPVVDCVVPENMIREALDYLFSL